MLESRAVILASIVLVLLAVAVAWLFRRSGRPTGDAPAAGMPAPERLDRLVREARRDLSPWTPTPEERVAWIGGHCGVAEIEAVIARLDTLSRERDALPEWDGDSQDDIARAQSLFRHILACVPARHIGVVAAGLGSPEWGTRIHVAAALAEHEREAALPSLRDALAAEGDETVRHALTQTIERLDDAGRSRP